jgi:hypothetical protein
MEYMSMQQEIRLHCHGFLLGLWGNNILPVTMITMQCMVPPLCNFDYEAMSLEPWTLQTWILHFAMVMLTIESWVVQVLQLVMQPLVLNNTCWNYFQKPNNVHHLCIWIVLVTKPSNFNVSMFFISKIQVPTQVYDFVLLCLE